MNKEAYTVYVSVTPQMHFVFLKFPLYSGLVPADLTRLLQLVVPFVCGFSYVSVYEFVSV